MNNIFRFLLSVLLVPIIACNSGQNKDLVAHKYTNKLSNETSPYLLQHAHNPVDWYPWGPEALEKAEAENKLIIVSVGYAACHWCHVMEHESFENEQVAEIMNKHFVSIKVDREERPDIDQVYMNAVQLMTGGGGWPLNCITLPTGEPIYGGTYFKTDHWISILQQLADVYHDDPTKVREYGSQLKQGVAESDLIELDGSYEVLSADVLDETVTKWSKAFDNIEGGPNRAPKFMLPNNYQFLMRYAALHKNEALDAHIELTLQKMAFGGIYDQLGGGFSRYSVDSFWKVPHFEKMLYDNAQLISLYAEAYIKYNKPLYKQIAEETYHFCKNELYAGDGIYYSSLDADSEGREGAYYVWTEKELKEVIPDQFKLVKSYYNVGQKGYWENGYNVLIRNKTDIEVATDLGISEVELVAQVTEAKEILNAHRSKRLRPALDDKSLTSWNALMVLGLIDLYNATQNSVYLEDAQRTMTFITQTQRKRDGGLNHNFKNGASKINGFLEDYCFTLEGLIKLYEVTFDEAYLVKAQELLTYVEKHFFDEKSGMYFFTSNADEALFARKTELVDNVIAGSNSSMANVLLKLGKLTGNDDLVKKSAEMLLKMQKSLGNYGSTYSNWGIVQLQHVYPFYEVAITGQNAVSYALELQQHYHPNKVVLGAEKESQIPLLKGKLGADELVIYVCVNKSCKLPVKSVKEAEMQLK